MEMGLCEKIRSALKTRKDFRMTKRLEFEQMKGWSFYLLKWKDTKEQAWRKSGIQFYTHEA